MEPRRIEIVGGLLSGALAVTALGVGLFAPLGTECTSTTDPSISGGCVAVSLVQSQGLASLWFAIALFGGLSLGIALFAVWHSRARSQPTLVLLWVCAVLLCFTTLITLLSVGVFFVPADVLAIVASSAGTRASQQRVPAHV